MIEVSAPSNIALIKYMGKTDRVGNLPTNPSLSVTLEELRTSVRVSKLSQEGEDDWKPLMEEGFSVHLSSSGRLRFLSFLSELKREMNVSDALLVESGNNFPSDCGLASSASSFAALTKGVYAYAKKAGLINRELSLEELSQLSQRGSGSSCRSFFSPFSVWESEGAKSIDVGFEAFKHFALVFEGEKKEVSSSKAHVQVLSSLNFLGRPERATKRLSMLLDSFQGGNWKAAYEICWAEFW
ncbi:MAG: diphosphomevalonate decarboxylase, partial [Bdellovibrionales bacterium]|nr:diphosphomevalonate decarboxylase [Bdellovibrionales bacterium]